MERLVSVKQNKDYTSKDLVKEFLNITEGEQDEDVLDGDFAADKAIDAFETMFNKFQLLGQECQKIGKEQPQKQTIQINKMQNFDSIKTTISRIVKLQAWFRKELTLKRLSKQLKDSKAAFNQKKSNQSPEEAALKEFSQQLMNKNLTPESFFRICDLDYKQNVQAGTFKDNLQRMGIKLSRGQLSRLIMILDEDMEGSITREEYYNALEAYNVSGEKHKSIDGSMYHPFEHISLFKLIVELRKKDISYIEMFNACDINDDTRVNILEIQRFVEGLSPDFKQKELHALMNYLDIDKNGLVDKDEFLRQLTKGEQTYKQSQVLNKQILERKSMTNQNFNNGAQKDNNLFEEVETGGGDQSLFGFVDNVFSRKKVDPKVQDKPPMRTGQQTQQKQVESLDPETQRRKLIIEKMEKEGQNFTSFFSSIKQMSTGGAITLGSLLKAVEVSYPTISSVDRNFVIKGCMIDARRIDFLQLEALFTRFSKSLKPSVSQTFSIISGNIIKRMGGGSAQECIRQFFRAQNVGENEMLSDMEFTQMFSGKFSQISSSDLDQAFRSLNIDMDGFIQVRDMIEVLISYSANEEKLSINVKELGQIIPGFETMSPRTRCEEIVQLIIGELTKKNMKPLNVYKMADSKNAGGVQASVLEMTFKKILPHIKQEVISESMNAFNAKNPRDIITRQDFETVFTEEIGQYIPNSQSITNKNQSLTQNKSSTLQVPTEDESMKWIRKLDNAMLRERISPGVAFKAADVNHNNVVTVDELKESIKRLIPEESLSLMDLKKVMMAFDKNRNGLIEEDEFIILIEKARNSNITIVESPQKQRLQNNDISSDRKGALPLKNQDNTGQKLDYNSMEMIVENLERKTNLKKFFGEVTLSEDGQVIVTHVARRFKTLETSDGQGLKPSEYLSVIKALDPQQKSTVEIKDLLKFLEKYSTSFETDCTLELKFMANFIEFQMKNRNTKQFFISNTKLTQGQRVIEIELMTEIQRVFGISMQIGRLLFNHVLKLKGKGDVMLEDICKLIDQYRVVQVSQQQEQAQTQSKKLDASKTLLKFVLNLVSIPSRRRDVINSRIIEIDRVEKSIPYKDFFDLFVTEYQLIDIPESKALFEHLCSLGKKPKLIEISMFQNSVLQTQELISKAQDQAIGQCIEQQGEVIFNNLTKIKMNDMGYLSKNAFKEHLISYGVVNKKNINSQDSDYAKNFRTLIKMDDYELSQYVQADEYIDSILRDENENCRVWTIVEFMSRTNKIYEYLTPIIIKYLGKLLDQIAPNKSTSAAIIAICPQFTNIQDGVNLVQMIEKLEENLMKKIQGFDQGQIRENSKKCLQAIFGQLGNKPFKITNDDHPLIKSINKNRALLPRSGDQDPKNASINDRELPDSSDLVQKLEQQLGMNLERALEFIYEQDQMPINSFVRSLMKEIQDQDRTQVSQLCRIIDTKNNGMVTTKDVIKFLKGVNGKYDAPKVYSQLAQSVDGPVDSFFAKEGISATDNLSKYDFLDVIKAISNISYFHALCIYFDLEQDQENFILGKQLFQLIKDAKQKKDLDDSREEKKSVRFGESVTLRNEESIKSLCNYYLKNFDKISQNSVIQSSLTKFQNLMNGVKTNADAVSKIDPSGKGTLSIDQFKIKVDEMKGFTEDEKMVVLFLPINQVPNDAVLVNIQNYIKAIRLMKFDDQIILGHKKILTNNLTAVKKYLGIEEEQKSNKESSPKKNQNLTKEKREKQQRKILSQMKDAIEGLKILVKNPKNKQELIDLFVNARKQKVSYKQFYDFLAKYMDIRALETQLEGEKLTCGMLEYTIVPERDFYIPGKTTILNNEKAALVMAEKIYNSLPNDEEYFDKEFGPKDENDVDGSKYSIYCNGIPPKGYIEVDQMSWLRPEEFSEKNPQFIDDGPAPNDVKQGKLGDCWFIGALSVLATRDELLRGGIGSIEVTPEFEADAEIAQKFSQGVYPPIFHYYRKKGIYILRFFKEFNWRYVIIDDRIPCFSYSQKPVFGQCSQLHELWVPLLEKAYAKLHGCYESLISGFIDDALNDMTGLVAEKIFLHNEQKIFPHKGIKDKEEFWTFLYGLSQSNEKSMMGCSVVGDVERQIVIDGVKTGIMTGHAYGIIDIFEIKGPRKVHRLLRVRNPWGEMEWKGKWGDTSEELVTYKDIIQQQYIAKLSEDEKFQPGVEDGTFLINYQSWRDLYNNMYICVDFPSSWSAIRFRGSWDSKCSGGVPSPMTPENMKKWGLNPQYLFDCDEDFEIFISLAQPDGRAKRPDGKYLKFPYSELIHPILFTVLQLPAGKDRLDSFDKTLVKGASVLKEHKEVSLRLKLPKGRYLIVPCTRNQGEYGEFILSMYFSVDLEEVEITRLDQPDDEFVLIEEETEKYDNVEDWKIDLCEKRIKYMIFQEDESFNDSSMLNTSKLRSGLKLSEAMDRATSKNKNSSSPDKFGFEEAFPEGDDDIE